MDVVKALLEVGRRELVMLTADDEVSCLYTSGENGHLDVVKVGCASWCWPGTVIQLPLRQWASGCGESAAGGRGARAGDAD